MSNELLFIADLISQKEAQEQGHIAAPRWFALRDDLKEKHIKAAEEIVAQWAEENLKPQAKKN